MVEVRKELGRYVTLIPSFCSDGALITTFGIAHTTTSSHLSHKASVNALLDILNVGEFEI